MIQSQSPNEHPKHVGVYILYNMMILSLHRYRDLLLGLMFAGLIGLDNPDDCSQFVYT